MENTSEKKLHEVAEIQLSYKSNVKPSQRPKVCGSREAYELLLANWDLSKVDLVEQFKVLFLNRANRALGIYEASTGGISGTVADPKLIMVAALKAGASSFIISHNHPSGNRTASQADIDLTRKLKGAAKFLEMQLLDHIIMTSEGYYSFADEGIL